MVARHASRWCDRCHTMTLTIDDDSQRNEIDKTVVSRRVIPPDLRRQKNTRIPEAALGRLQPFNPDQLPPMQEISIEIQTQQWYFNTTHLVIEVLPLSM